MMRLSKHETLVPGKFGKIKAPNYDPKLFENFVRRTEGFKVPIQYGLVVIKSPNTARCMNEHAQATPCRRRATRRRPWA